MQWCLLCVLNSSDIENKQEGIISVHPSAARAPAPRLSFVPVVLNCPPWPQTSRVEDYYVLCAKTDC